MKENSASNKLSNLHPSNSIVFGTYHAEEQDADNPHDTSALGKIEPFSHPSNDILFGTLGPSETDLEQKSFNNPEIIIPIQKTSLDHQLASRSNPVTSKNPIAYLLNNLMRLSFLVQKPKKDQESEVHACEI